MPDYFSPGVYVEEVPSSMKPIAGVSTSTPVFIGMFPDTIKLVAPMRPTPTDPHTSQMVPFTVPTASATPVLITSWSQFTDAFGDLVGIAPTPDPKKPPDHASTVDEGHRNLALAVYGFFNNGGSRCYVARIVDDTELDGLLTTLTRIDEIAIVAAPGLTTADHLIDYALRQTLVEHCAKAGGRFAILDGPSKVDATALDELTHVQPTDKTKDPAGVMPEPTDLAAWYFPWVRVLDPATRMLVLDPAIKSTDPFGDGTVLCPPSGHIAGVYARVDSQRGVHKAPANEVIRGAIAPAQALNRAEQDRLNPIGVNCIRVINDNVTVWGARTVGGYINADLKYINVRRTLLFLRKSIEQGTQWVVFEPNDSSLWQKITRNVDAFLTHVWRSGALFGDTPQQAFYVKCDASTNTPESIALGQVITEIGVAIVRPAEFVIFRISQYSAT